MVSLTMRSTCAATRTSTAIDFATPPAFSISVALLLADSARTSATITFAPSSAKRIALARPIPEPAPVINATLSLSNIIRLLCDLGRDRCPTLVIMRGDLKGSRPDRQTAFVREIYEMAFDRGGVAVAIAPGQDVYRQRHERQVDEHSGPRDIWRADPEQHCDSKDHHPRIE